MVPESLQAFCIMYDLEESMVADVYSAVFGASPSPIRTEGEVGEIPEEDLVQTGGEPEQTVAVDGQWAATDGGFNDLKEVGIVLPGVCLHFRDRAVLVGQSAGENITLARNEWIFKEKGGRFSGKEYDQTIEFRLSGNSIVGFEKKDCELEILSLAEVLAYTKKTFKTTSVYNHVVAEAGETKYSLKQKHKRYYKSWSAAGGLLLEQWHQQRLKLTVRDTYHFKTSGGNKQSSVALPVENHAYTPRHTYPPRKANTLSGLRFFWHRGHPRSIGASYTMQFSF